MIGKYRFETIAIVWTLASVSSLFFEGRSSSRFPSSFSLNLMKPIQAPSHDKQFWSEATWIDAEPNDKFESIVDIVHTPYIGNWSYYYRKNGMKTSADDIIVSYLACMDHTTLVDTYIDLGTGIGSSLLVVARQLQPRISVGIEGQSQSIQLLNRTLNELDTTLNISLLHADIRNCFDFDGKAQLITANPPYAPLRSGTLCKDSQRRSARFEIRGGIEAYMIVAQRMLALDGRFICAFWNQNSGELRLRRSAKSVKLKVVRSIKVFMGNVDTLSPHLTVYELVHMENMCRTFNTVLESDSVFSRASYEGNKPEEITMYLNITKGFGQGYNDIYYRIKSELNLRK